MAVEQFRNLAETTLASSYTSGGSSISVVSASGFPTTGTFRLAIGNTDRTVYRVDSVSGTTFTGGADFNDANASSGASVKLVGTREAAERLLQSPSTSEVGSPAGVSGASRYGPIFAITPLDQSAWSWINQGSAAVTQSGGIVFLSAGSSAANNLRIRKTTAPAAPYTLTTALLPALFAGASSGFAGGGLCFRQSTTGKVITFQLYAVGATRPNVYVERWTSATVFSATSTNNACAMGSPVWLRIADDNTNLVFSASGDSVNWVTINSQARGTFMTVSGGVTGPDEYGIIVYDDSGPTGTGVSFIHAVVS